MWRNMRDYYNYTYGIDDEGIEYSSDCSFEIFCCGSSDGHYDGDDHSPEAPSDRIGLLLALAISILMMFGGVLRA